MLLFVRTMSQKLLSSGDLHRQSGRFSFDPADQLGVGVKPSGQCGLTRYFFLACSTAPAASGGSGGDSSGSPMDRRFAIGDKVEARVSMVPETWMPAVVESVNYREPQLCVCCPTPNFAVAPSCTSLDTTAQADVFSRRACVVPQPAWCVCSVPTATERRPAHLCTTRH
jgi:hypothetical protein